MFAIWYNLLQATKRRLIKMNEIFNGIPLPEKTVTDEYYCGRGTYLLRFENCTKHDFDGYCEKLEDSGFQK